MLSVLRLDKSSKPLLSNMKEEDLGKILKDHYLAKKPRWNALVSLMEFVAMESIPDDDTQAYIIIPLVKTKDEHFTEDWRDAETMLQTFLNPEIEWYEDED